MKALAVNLGLAGVCGLLWSMGVENAGDFGVGFAGVTFILLLEWAVIATIEMFKGDK